MKKKRVWNTGMAWCLVLMMIITAYLPVLAWGAQEQAGSIQLQLPVGQDSLEMMLYSVADYADGSYIISEDFAESGITISDLNNSKETQEAAEKLAAYAKERKLKGAKAKPDESGLVNFTGLVPALYLAAQCAGDEVLNVQAALVPIPYMSEDGTEIYDAVLSPKYSFPGGAVIVTKVDEEGQAVGEAQFVLQQKTVLDGGETAPDGAETGSDGSGSYYWKEFRENLVTSVNGQIVVTDMPIGDYRFVEVQAPAGYVLNAEPAYFSITQAGQVAEVQGMYHEESGLVAEVNVVNTQTSVKFNKVDAYGNPVSGAKLILKDADGQVILDEQGNAKYVFTSGEKPFELKRLPAGDYYLCEVETPEGYQVAKDVPLTVSGTEAVTVEVTMVDEKEEPTSGNITVIKRLADMEDNELAAEDDTFYVALFADAELTDRVSGVKALEYHGNSTSSVTFQNLQMDTAYYVCETDEYGDPLESIMLNEVLICIPMYPDDVQEVKPTEKDPQHEYSFDNVFLELPDGYYYVGKLTVTKEVLKGEEPYDTDEVFYAGVFEDEAYTQRVGDVITLEMNGGSEASNTVEVPIGEHPDDVKTYYVTETDQDGVPLEGRTDLAFQVSVDHTEVTFSLEETEQEVIITNTYPEETPVPSETPVPTESPAPTETSVTSAPGGHSSGSSSSTGVKTGDSTPISMFVVILIAAAAVIIGAMVYRKKKK